MGRAERPTFEYDPQEIKGLRVKRAKSNGIADHARTVDWRNRIQPEYKGAGSIAAWFIRASRSRGKTLRFEPAPPDLMHRYNHHRTSTMSIEQLIEARA